LVERAGEVDAVNLGADVRGELVDGDRSRRHSGVLLVALHRTYPWRQARANLKLNRRSSMSCTAGGFQSTYRWSPYGSIGGRIGIHGRYSRKMRVISRYASPRNFSSTLACAARPSSSKRGWRQ